MSHKIRATQSDDWPQIYSLIERVFLRKDESRFMKQLNESSEIVSSYIIERNAEILGLIVYSRLQILNLENGQPLQSGLVMAPFIIDPAWQGHGLGSELIEFTHEKIQEGEEKICFLLGEESYYSRFGYKNELAEGFESPYQGPYLLAATWSDELPSKGKLEYPQAFADVAG